MTLADIARRQAEVSFVQKFHLETFGAICRIGTGTTSAPEPAIRESGRSADRMPLCRIPGVYPV